MAEDENTNEAIGMAADALHAPEPGRERPTDNAVSARYAALPSRDTTPEVALRRALWRAGFRYRVQYAVPGLPRRKVDIAFTRKKVAVQVDGCFWHGCPEHCVPPTRNAEWWRWKIARNRARDHDTDEKLAALGWTVVRVWEHDPVDTAFALVVARLTGAAQAEGRDGLRQETGRGSGARACPGVVMRR